jgi:phage terminase large subunit
VTLRHDAIGVGAGVRGVYETSDTPLGFETHAVHVGASRTEDCWPDGETSKEKFVNLRSELWWKLRARFEKTYEHATGQAVHRPEETISLPDDPELIAELSQPTVRRRESGKLALGSQADLRKRGVKSPNRADALALASAADGRDWSGLARGRSDSVWAGPDVLRMPRPPDEDDDFDREGPRCWWDREF